MADKRIREMLAAVRHDLEDSRSINPGEWGYEASALGRRVVGLWRKDGSLTLAGADMFAAFGANTLPEEKAWRFLEYLFGKSGKKI